ncbi:hypothetical protein GD488_17625 [Salmonella enterica]|nr:hypothetical protein [Salmonella enterica]
MTGNLILRSDARMHLVIQNADGSARAYIFKDKGGDGVRISNGVDGGGDFVFNKNGEFYSPSNLHAGAATLANDGNIWGTRWNASGQWIWDAIMRQFAARDNSINTRATWDWVNQNSITDVRYSAETQVGANGVWSYHSNTVLTGFNNRDGDYSAESLFWSEIQICKNGQWLVVGR